jgi:hypothetical protein
MCVVPTYIVTVFASRDHMRRSRREKLKPKTFVIEADDPVEAGETALDRTGTGWFSSNYVWDIDGCRVVEAETETTVAYLYGLGTMFRVYGNERTVTKHRWKLGET